MTCTCPYLPVVPTHTTNHMNTLCNDQFPTDRRHLPYCHQSPPFVTLAHFECSLGYHILSCRRTRDVVRCNGRLDPSQDSVNIRIRFGLGRIQHADYGINLLVNRPTYPPVNVKLFQSIPSALKDQLTIPFQDSTHFTKSWIKDSFPNNVRNATCAGYLNSLMGYSKLTSLFEYFDVILCRNTITRKHCDLKNNHRKEYNICTDYNFVMLNWEEYKVSVIMTTRYTVGSGCDNA